MQTVGFEPTRANTLRPERSTLDHSVIFASVQNSNSGYIRNMSLIHSPSLCLMQGRVLIGTYSPLHLHSSFSFSPLYQNSDTSLCCACLFHQRLDNSALPHREMDTIGVKQTGATTFPRITDLSFPAPWGIPLSPHEGRPS